jgi:glycosyltransferase involved in cell wall biosynthesis
MNKTTQVGINRQLDREEKPIRAIYISSYIPRKCGIATFTKDLTTSINNLNPRALGEIIAVTDEGQSYEYPWEVKVRISQNSSQDYSMAANYINQSGADVINLQHEFGLFGGVDGDYILPLLDTLTKPVITNFHTILPNPDEHKKYIMKRIIDKSAAVIAMTQNTRLILRDVYGCPLEKTAVIHHGVPDFAFNHTVQFKKQLGMTGKTMILTSGLISPGKGLQYVIQALPEIVKQHPDTVLYIVGETHPVLLRNEGEKYRESLEALVKENNLQDNVVFVNKYLSLEDLIDYYKAADIFITAHTDPQQPTSGTLSYALGAGNVCISTPYNYAQEVLANDVGLLVDFNDHVSISTSVLSVLNDKKLMDVYKSKAYRFGRLMTWPSVAARYLNLFKIIIDKNEYESSDQNNPPKQPNGQVWGVATS